MAIKKTNPTSAGRRGYSYSDQSDITASEPLKKLLDHKVNTGGRNESRGCKCAARPSGRHGSLTVV